MPRIREGGGEGGWRRRRRQWAGAGAIVCPPPSSSSSSSSSFTPRAPPQLVIGRSIADASLLSLTYFSARFLCLPGVSSEVRSTEVKLEVKLER